VISPRRTKQQPQSLDVRGGSRIRLRRVEREMRQNDLADALGITYQMVQKYENGANRVSASRLQAIADALSTSPSYFFDGDRKRARAPRKTESDTLITLVKDEQARRLIRAFCAINDKRLRGRIVGFVEQLQQGGRAKTRKQKLRS
jgi:transcriptional regulator with XRE-family HTH domain